MAIKDAPVVDIIEFDKNEAYNHDRPISSLIRTQLVHLHHAEYIAVPAKKRTNININTLLTELQASDYIQKVTALLHKHGKTANKSAKKKKAAGKMKSKKAVTNKKVGAKAKKSRPAGKKRKSRK